MARMALLVGVNSYPPPAVTLKAPVKEMNNWQSILSNEFEFGKNVVPLSDSAATRPRVLLELRKLLSRAVDGDQVVIGFTCHGAETFGWKSDSEVSNEREYAFIVYAGTGPVIDFQAAAVTPSDIARILTEAKPPAGVQIVLLADCCSAEKFDRSKKYEAPAPINPKVLHISNAVYGLPEAEPRHFDSISALVDDDNIAVPIILASSRFDEPADEVGPDNDRRTLFAQKAIDRLYKAFDAKASLNHDDLIGEINPLSANQEAAIQGNTSLSVELLAGGFPGKPRKVTATAAHFAARVLHGASPSEAQGTRNEKTLTETSSLRIRIFGLVSLIDLPAKPPYRNRLVMPYDDQAKCPGEMHRAFIEVADTTCTNRRSVMAARTICGPAYGTRDGILLAIAFGF